jgi:energy-converting hydrogenase Eha subunit A
MVFSQRGIAIAALIVGILLILWSVWLERRRKHQLMPSLIAPMPLMIFGGAVAFISIIVLMLPSRL